MAKTTILKERETKEVLYPLTVADQVMYDESHNVKETLVKLGLEVAESVATGSYTIDLIQGNVVQEYNALGDFTITSIELVNVSDITLTVGNTVKPAESGTEVPKGSLLTWEISKINNELPAAVGIKYSYND